MYLVTPRSHSCSREVSLPAPLPAVVSKSCLHCVAGDLVVQTLNVTILLGQRDLRRVETASEIHYFSFVKLHVSTVLRTTVGGRR